MLFNDAFTRLFSLILSPFDSLSPEWGLLIVSVISGIILLLIYGRVSNQNAIRNTKRKIYANLLESVLFRHDIRTSLKAQGKMFGHGLLYFAWAVPPIIVLMVPCVLILAQLNLRYNVRGFGVGEDGILSVRIDKRSMLYGVSLETPPEVQATAPIRVEESGEVFWRIKSENAGKKEVKIKIAPLNAEIKKEIEVGVDAGKPIVAESYREWWWELLYPGDSILGKLALPVSSISLTYPERSYKVLGLQMHWLVVFFLVSFISGLIASRIFKVEI